MTKVALQRVAVGKARTAEPAAARPRPSRPRTGAIGNQAHLRHLQAKLEVGPADHPLEREADAVADRVMRMADPARAPAISSADHALSRKCKACGEEEAALQRKAAGAADQGLDATALAGEVIASPGAPLDASTRAFFEPRFGRDLGGVRVHTDAAAAASARALGALAYTVGSDVVFADGRYAPANDAGRRLLAHELVHTVQQGSAGGAPATAARSPDLGISTAGEPQIQRVGECAAYPYRTCGGQACVPNNGKGTGFCRWSGTIANGCICIPIEQPMLRRFVETVLMAALIAVGVVLAVEAVLAIVACFASGACELAALIGVLGAAGAAVLISLLPGSGASTGAGPGPTAAADTGADSGASGGGGSPGAAPSAVA